jgi:hypothetical protein
MTDTTKSSQPASAKVGPGWVISSGFKAVSESGADIAFTTMHSRLPFPLEPGKRKTVVNERMQCNGPLGTGKSGGTTLTCALVRFLMAWRPSGPAPASSNPLEISRPAPSSRI